MIVGSLLLILVAVVLLVFGLTNGSSGMLIGSIGASLLAAVGLVVGARQDTVGGSDYDEESDAGVREDEADPAYAVVGSRAARAGQRPGSGRDVPPPADPMAVTVPTQPAYGGPVRGQRRPPWDEPAVPNDGAGAAAMGGPHAPPPVAEPAPPPPAQPVEVDDGFDDEDPPDEPVPQVVSAGEAARVAGLHTDVLVIDGRPRYHLPGCVHLLGRQSEPLPVSEAVELGFTPCSLCEPASALLTDPRLG